MRLENYMFKVILLLNKLNWGSEAFILGTLFY